MEALTRLVSDSLARHGFDRPVDPRRLQWSRWFRCDSPHSLLVVPSKPGIFAIAEEILNLPPSLTHVGTAALESLPRAQSRGPVERSSVASFDERDSATESISKRMLAVLQFSEDDNMAYVLDRMFTHINPMRSRLHSGNCFVRFVVVEDQAERRTICAALNQWMRNSAERASGIPADFSSSLELASEDVAGENVARAPSPSSRHADATHAVTNDASAGRVTTILDSGASKNLHCPQALPSGF
jgi:hypothetical protein